MTLVVERPGLQTLVQAGPRDGYRNRGVPGAGAADVLSLALANRLVGNALDAAALEVTLSGVGLRANAPCRVAVTGASCAVRVDGSAAGMHRCLDLAAGQHLEVGTAESGARSYLAIAGAFRADSVLGSASTYLPAGLGGHRGRSLAAGDVLELAGDPQADGIGETPGRFRLSYTDSWTLRALPGAEMHLLYEEQAQRLFHEPFSVSSRNDRMGVQLDTQAFRLDSTGVLDSRPVFPGTVQCPESGIPFLLGVDAQTTGGYPRIAEVTRLDRHLTGQLRTGNRVRFLKRSADEAVRELHAAHEFWSEWLPGIDALL